LKIAGVSPARLARLTVAVAIAVAAVFATTASAGHGSGHGGGQGNKPKYTPCQHVFKLDQLINAVAQETGTAPVIKSSPDSPPGRADPAHSGTGGPITFCESFFPEGTDSSGNYGFGNATAYGYFDGYVPPAWGWVVGTDVSKKAFKKLRTDYRDPPLPGGESGGPYTTQDFTIPLEKGNSGFVGVVDMSDSVHSPPQNAYEYYVYERTKNGGLLMLHTWPLSLEGSEAAVNAAVNDLGKNF
jgi:hypothetical protein